MGGELPFELRHGVATSLEEMALAIEDLGARLCQDPHVVAQFLDRLQTLDLVAQTLRCNAGVLSAKDPALAVRDVPLDELSKSLSRALPLAQSDA